MNSKLPHLEHALVNILASMTLDLPDYPRIFFETGYSIDSIERQFEVIKHGQVLQYKFDLVLNNTDANHSLAVEAKSGGTNRDQLERYQVLSSNELVSVGGVPSHNPSSHTHNVSIVFNAENQSQIVEETEGFGFPMISISGNPGIIIRHMGQLFDDEQVQEYLNQPINYPDLIHEVFPVHSQTPLHKYVKLVCAQLVSFSVIGDTDISLGSLVPKVASRYEGLWPSRIGEEMRETVRKNVERVLLQGSRYELKEFFAWNNSTKHVSLRKIKPGCKRTSYIAFKEHAQEMSERIRTSSPIPPRYLTKKDTPRPLPDQSRLDIPDEE